VLLKSKFLHHEKLDKCDYNFREALLDSCCWKTHKYRELCYCCQRSV